MLHITSKSCKQGRKRHKPLLPPPTRLCSISRPTAGAGGCGTCALGEDPLQQFRLRTPLGKAPGQDWPFSLVFQAPHFGWCFPQLAPSLETAPGRRNFCPCQRKGSVLAGAGLPDPCGSLPTQHTLGFCGNCSRWNRNTEFLVAHPPGQGRRGLFTLTEDTDVSEEKKRKCLEKEEVKRK